MAYDNKFMIDYEVVKDQLPEEWHLVPTKPLHPKKIPVQTAQRRRPSTQTRRTPNASHNCSDEKQHHKELQVIQTEGEELFKHVRQVQVQPAQSRWKSKLKLSPKDKHIIISNEKKRR